MIPVAQSPNMHPQVNIQDDKDGLGSLNYDLSDLSCWEHLLAGEPQHRRQLTGVDTSDKKSAVETEKHLDMPYSWVEKLDISGDGECREDSVVNGTGNRFSVCCIRKRLVDWPVDA